MRYEEIAAVYLQPREDDGANPTLPTSPARRLRDALEPIATHGWWNRLTNERLEAAGLDFMGSYVWGRAAALGEPAAGVVVAAFGVFEPGFLTTTYETARRTVTRADVLAARQDGTEASLAAILGDARSAASVVAGTLLECLDRLDGAGRPLFSGLRELDRGEDELVRLWRAAELVREHRGDGHIAACVAAGLRADEMTVLTELWLGIPIGTYLATRGYGPEALASVLERLGERALVSGSALTGLGRDLRVGIEDATDASQDELIASLGGDVDGIIEVVAPWSDRIIGARAFPSDPFKRAAG